MDKAKRPLLVVAGLVLIVVASCSCSLLDKDASPLQKYSDTQDAYVLALGIVMAAKETGIIEQEDWDKYVLPAIEEGSALLDRMEVMVSQDRFDEVELLRMSLLKVIIKLQMQRIK